MRLGTYVYPTTTYFAHLIFVVYVWRALPDLSCGLRADECLVVLTRGTGSRVQFSRGSSGAGAQLGKRHESHKNASSTLVPSKSRAGQSVTCVDVGNTAGLSEAFCLPRHVKSNTSCSEQAGNEGFVLRSLCNAH